MTIKYKLYRLYDIEYMIWTISFGLYPEYDEIQKYFRAEYKKQDAFAMEVADCALSDQIEKFETEIDFENEKFHFDAIFMKRMIEGKS